MPSTTSRPPLTRFTTPAGRPSASSSSNAICCVIGTCSDGFSTNVLPQAIANGRNQNGTIAGKLKGTIAAHTPTGWRTVSASMLRETSSRMRPCIVVGIAVAASTISIMRATSARASPIVLPISVVTERARSSLRAARRSRSSNSLRARAMTDTARHSGSAARAAATAASRSARPESGTRAEHSPACGVDDIQFAGGGLCFHPAPGDVVVEQPCCGRSHVLMVLSALRRPFDDPSSPLSGLLSAGTRIVI